MAVRLYRLVGVRHDCLLRPGQTVPSGQKQPITDLDHDCAAAAIYLLANSFLPGDISRPLPLRIIGSADGALQVFWDRDLLPCHWFTLNFCSTVMPSAASAVDFRPRTTSFALVRTDDMPERPSCLRCESRRFLAGVRRKHICRRASLQIFLPEYGNLVQ